MADQRKTANFDDAEKEAKHQAEIEAALEVETEVDAPRPPDVEIPRVALVLKDDAADDIAFSTAGPSPDDDYTDEHGRVVLSHDPVEVPVNVAENLLESDLVEVAE